MIAEAGHYALVLALALALIQSTVPMLGARWRDPALMNVARSTALAQLLFVAASFAALVTLHVTSDFSVVNVFENSHSLKPLIYKITGVWGNHEGSMLLWVSILALFGGLVAAFGNNLPLSLRAHVLAVQAWIASAFYLFILITSNPFLRIANPPIEGRDLNPVLQDIGLAVHPPMLYLGYVGFSISFSFAVAALIEGRIDAAWARWVRPWTLVAWIFLTLGIAMGSYWAYYELGWGGWWFWDPVENASLMPWLAGTALLHSAVVMEKRNALKVWTILLSILTFSLSLLGTFLVRSGVLTSVHAFATDPTRGVFILLILCIFIGGSLSLYAWRASALKQGGLFAPISREGALVLNNLFLTTACATVFIGTLYPLALEVMTGDKISVGAPFFNLTFAPLFVPLMIAVPFGPLLAWKRGDLLGAAQRLIAAGIAALIAIAVLWAWTRRRQHLRAARDRAGGVRHRRRVERSCRAHRPVPRAVRDRAAARARIAALDLGHGVRPCRRRRGADRDRLRDHLEQRIYRIDEARRRRQDRRLRVEARRRDAAAGAEFPRNGGAVHGQSRRRAAQRDDAVEAQFHHAGIDHDRSRAADARRQPALYFARRYRRRRRDRGAHLSQADGAADLVRPGADGVRRHAVAVGPAAAGRRAEAGEGAARIAGGGVMPLKRISLACLAFAVLVMLDAPPAYAVQPDEIMSDPAKEVRARDLSRELRCMVCQNQSIDDSEAPLARDLRLLVRERIAAGDSDAQVMDFLVARYGEFVLLKPRLEPHTLLLWLLPPLALGRRRAGAVDARPAALESRRGRRPIRCSN